MANTFSVDLVERGSKQRLGAEDMIFVRGTISDQDAVADDVSAEVTLTVPGAALGDHVMSVALSVSQADANASIHIFGYVSAADTVILKMTNIDATTDAFDADTLNGSEYTMIILKPSW